MTIPLIQTVTIIYEMLQIEIKGVKMTSGRIKISPKDAKV